MAQEAAVLERNEVRPLSLAIFVSVQLLLVLILAHFDATIYLPLVIAAIFYFVWSLRYPVAWLFTVILFYILILVRSEGITIWEVLFGLYCYGATGIWFVRKWVKGERIAFTFADRMLLVFEVLCVLSFVPGMLDHADPEKWFRESIIFFSYLFYFPAREVILRYKSLQWIGLGFLILASYVAISNFVKYKTMASSAVYVWQLLSGRQTANEPLILTVILVGIALYLYARSKSLRLVLLGVISFFAIALAVTFSRGYWIGAFVGIAALLYFIKGQKRWKLVISLGALSAAAVLIVLIFFPSTGTTILKSMEQRLSSGSLNPTRDLSLESRLSETKVVVQAIFSNPILGYGLGVLFKFFDPVQKFTYETWYVHNGYLFLWFKIGLFGLIAYVLAYGSMIRDAYALFTKHRDSFEAHLLLGVASVLIAMLVISLTSPQFITRDSILIINLSWAIIGAFKIKSSGSRLNTDSQVRIFW